MAEPSKSSKTKDGDPQEILKTLKTLARSSNEVRPGVQDPQDITNNLQHNEKPKLNVSLKTPDMSAMVGRVTSYNRIPDSRIYKPTRLTKFMKDGMYHCPEPGCNYICDTGSKFRYSENTLINSRSFYFLFLF